MNSISIVKDQMEPLDISAVIKQLGFDLDRSLAGRTGEYIVVIDEQERLIYATDWALEWAGVRLEEIKGKNYRQLKAKYLNDHHSILLETLETGINYEGILEAFDLSKQIFYVESSTALLVNSEGLKVGALLFARNVTARINGAKQMQQYETMKTVNAFASSMAHHLKNPLTAVAGFIQLIQHQTAPENNEQYCEWALEELHRIEEVLDRISHLAFPSGGQQLIALPDLLQGIKRSMQTTATTMKVKVQMDENPPEVIIKGHYEQLREAVLCLVHNGMEAMPSGGYLTVSAHYHRSLTMVEIRVVDRGAGGYNPDYIFQPFYSSHVDRTGLGLNIAEHIAMIHRGYIRLQPNETGMGTKASFYLPAAVNIFRETAGIGVN
ncbi:MAG: two-component system sensor histidine kinase NtrB [Methylocystaceae bacterium]